MDIGNLGPLIWIRWTFLLLLLLLLRAWFILVSHLELLNLSLAIILGWYLHLNFLLGRRLLLNWRAFIDRSILPHLLQITTKRIVIQLFFHVHSFLLNSFISFTFLSWYRTLNSVQWRFWLVNSSLLALRSLPHEATAKDITHSSWFLSRSSVASIVSFWWFRICQALVVCTWHVLVLSLLVNIVKVSSIVVRWNVW